MDGLLQDDLVLTIKRPGFKERIRHFAFLQELIYSDSAVRFSRHRLRANSHKRGRLLDVCHSEVGTDRWAVRFAAEYILNTARPAVTPYLQSVIRTVAACSLHESNFKNIPSASEVTHLP